MRHRWIGMCIAACVSVAYLGQTTAPVPATPAQEIERLKAENEELRREVASLKAKLSPTAATSQTQPGRKEKVRMFTTMMDALANAPEDLRPQLKPEWFKFTEGKFLAWAREQFIGLTIDTSLQYYGGPTGRNVFGKGDAAWIKYGGAFAAKKFTYFGAEHEWRVRYPTMTFDEAGARKWDAIKPGALFKVKGTIKSVSIDKGTRGSSGLPSYRFLFELDHPEITPPK